MPTSFILSCCCLPSPPIPAPSSGGERNRVHLAKMLRSGCNVLMLDEPTNDLDVDTLRALEDALPDFVGSAIVRLSCVFSGVSNVSSHIRPVMFRCCSFGSHSSMLCALFLSSSTSPRAAQVISHDRWFLDRICTHILAFEGDGRTVFVEGNFSEYEQDRRKRVAEAKTVAAAAGRAANKK
jgi:ATPase subunit of ABC transporter with duplicated ATPase domains